MVMEGTLCQGSGWQWRVPYANRITLEAIYRAMEASL